MTITFYDIPSTLPGSAWSPNTFKTRMTLNFKGIPYKTIYVEYPDIKETCQRIGAEPTFFYRDGTPLYTLPVIHDSETGKVISDSFKIAIYLDERFPESTRAIPEGTRGLMKGFDMGFQHSTDPWDPFIMMGVCNVLNPTSAAFFRQSREPQWGKLEEIIKPEERDAKWAEVEKSFKWIENRLDENASEGFTGGFVVGDTLTYADMIVGSWILWFRVLGEDSKEWQDVMSLNGGRWARYLRSLEKLYRVTETDVL